VRKSLSKGLNWALMPLVTENGVPRSKDILKVTVCATAFLCSGQDVLRCS